MRKVSTVIIIVLCACSVFAGNDLSDKFNKAMKDASKSISNAADDLAKDADKALDKLGKKAEKFFDNLADSSSDYFNKFMKDMKHKFKDDLPKETEKLPEKTKKSIDSLKKEFAASKKISIPSWATGVWADSKANTVVFITSNDIVVSDTRSAYSVDDKLQSIMKDKNLEKVGNNTKTKGSYILTASAKTSSNTVEIAKITQINEDTIKLEVYKGKALTLTKLTK